MKHEPVYVSYYKVKKGAFHVSTPTLHDWSQAERLAEWLNQDKPEIAQGQGMVGKAIGLLREMERLAQGRARFPEDSEPGKAILQAWVALRQQLKPLKWIVLPLGRHYAVDLSWKTETEYGFMLLRDVSTAGIMDRLRQCKRCSKWLVARRAKKTFCSPDCQADFWFEYRKTPKGLEEQRHRMHRWRTRQRRRKSQLRKEKR